MNLRLRSFVLTLGAACLFGGAARGDDVIIRSGKENAELPYKGCKVTLIKEGMIYWTVGGRAESHREIVNVKRVEVPGETALNNAEKLFYEAEAAEFAKNDKVARQKFGDAIPEYRTALSSGTAWVKQFAAIRIEAIAPKSGRFDIALDAWATKVPTDPAGAAKSKPSTEGIDPKSTYFTSAITKLNGLANATSNNEFKRIYLGMVVDIQRAQRDVAGENQTLEKLSALGGNPEEIAALQVKLAKVDVDNKNYDSALARIGKAGNLDVLPDQSRAEAYYYIAECKQAKAGGAASAEVMKEVAIDYMRVVAGFPNSPQAAPALLKVAQLLEGLKDNETALKTYQAVTKEYPTSPAAQAAKEGAERLGKSK